LIEERGLGKFYSLRDGSIQPVSESPSSGKEVEWFRGAVDEAEDLARSTGSPARLSLRVRGISCFGCTWLLEELFRNFAGGKRFSVDLRSGAATLEWDPGNFSAMDFRAEVIRFGYRFSPAAPTGSTHFDFGRLQICGVLAAASGLLLAADQWKILESLPLQGIIAILPLFLSLLSFGLGGLGLVAKAWDAARFGEIHPDLPLACGLTLGFLASSLNWLGDWQLPPSPEWFPVLMFVVLLGQWLQGRFEARHENTPSSEGGDRETLDQSQPEPGLAPPPPPLLQRITSVYGCLLIALSIIGGTVWSVFIDFRSGLQVALAVLLVSSPRSLVSIWMAINHLAFDSLQSRGIVPRNESLWARLSDIRNVFLTRSSLSIGDAPPQQGDLEELATKLQSQGLTLSCVGKATPSTIEARESSPRPSSAFIRADVAPESAANWIQRNASGGTLVIGNQSEDALAFTRAQCIGSYHSSPASIQTKSDFLLSQNGFAEIETLFRTRSWRSRQLRRSSACFAATAMVALSLSLAGFVSPMAAALALALIPLGCFATIRR
tara:strand:- start:4205 stop:5854 length:1650 start_codon:yes stop_codon:yes gene_type:complete